MSDEREQLAAEPIEDVANATERSLDDVKGGDNTPPGEPVTIPAATVPKFSAGSALKTAVRR